jgi:hypothetical protein
VIGIFQRLHLCNQRHPDFPGVSCVRDYHYDRHHAGDGVSWVDADPPRRNAGVWSALMAAPVDEMALAFGEDM